MKNSIIRPRGIEHFAALKEELEFFDKVTGRNALTHTFFGVPCDAEQFAVWLAKQNDGTCPFCNRTGLKNNYGSKRKHIAACAKKRVNRLRRQSASKARLLEIGAKV